MLHKALNGSVTRLGISSRDVSADLRTAKSSDIVRNKIVFVENNEDSSTVNAVKLVARLGKRGRRRHMEGLMSCDYCNYRAGFAV